MRAALLVLFLLAGADTASKFRKADFKTARQFSTVTTGNSAMAVGTQFVFSFLNSHLSANDQTYTENLFLTITNPSAITATVTVQSAYPTFVNQTAIVPPKTSMELPITPASIQVDYMDLDLNFAYRGNQKLLSNAFLETKSIWVNSNQPVKLVATNQHTDFGSEDSFAVLPICQLGTQYQAVADQSANPKTIQATNIITIIATQDNTNVTVKPILTNYAVLKAGEQLSIAVNFSASANLISATAPVAAFSGAVCGYGIKALQLYPIASYGTEYPVYKYMPEDYGDIMIFLTQFNTTLNEDGEDWPEMVGPDTYYVGPVIPGTYIKGDKPFYVAQVGNTNLQDQGAPFLVHVTPPNLFTTGPVTFQPGMSSDESNNMSHFCRIVTDLNSIGSIKVDDYAPNGLLYTRMGMSKYYFVDVQVKEAQHIVSSTKAGIKFAVTVYGYGFIRSYAFNAGLDLPTTGTC